MLGIFIHVGWAKGREKNPDKNSLGFFLKMGSIFFRVVCVHGYVTILSWLVGNVNPQDCVYAK